MTGAPWFGDLREPPEIGLSHKETADILTEELDGIPYVGFPFALQPFVVPRESYRELLDAMSRLLELERRAVRHLAPDRAGRLAALEMDDNVLATGDEEFEMAHDADMGRADVVLAEDGPKFVELNANGAVGGLVQFQLFQHAWQRVRQRAGRPAFVGADAYASIARYFTEICSDLGVPPAAAIVGSCREFGPGYSTKYFDVQADFLRRHGVLAEHFEPDELDRLIGPGGALRYRVGMAQFTVEEYADELGIDLDPVREVQAAGFRLYPSYSYCMVHSKKMLALLSEGQPWMSREERDFVDRYVPWTRLVRPGTATWQDRSYDLPELLLKYQERFVLKTAFGWAGREVTIGARSTPDEWAQTVQLALSRKDFVAQEFVEAVRFPVDVLHESGSVTRVSANSVISPFSFGGRPAGCFARFVWTENTEEVISGQISATLSCLLAEP
ncbi:hypothetical protein ACFQ05_41075 [Amycolatopsis umgeniensis]|uniref:Glutathionylspermidine synthase pre-ATP-grasp-like domain-containing protein n=1 Tax=Amycolatopsis umgeniensis TaxID=336628 RepID=A0A841BDU3_9PSEU|nr:hypothetical protein [Amycolatopsis umgeniensis]MBB5857507.1 hypothetical protein [Amycolatopsis umgeniensis]